MKLTLRILSLVAVLTSSALWAQTAPVTLTIRSYRAFADNFSKVVDSVSPGSAEEALGEMREGLGIQELKGIDLTRPWQVAVWATSISVPPCVSIRVPVSDFSAFKEGLDSGMLKGEDGSNQIQQVGNYATIWLELGTPTEATKTAEKAWKPELLKEVAGVVQLAVRPGAGLREELVGTLGMGRMMLGGAMSGQDPQVMGGMDPQAMTELLGVYFDMIETGVKGFESFEVALDLRGESLWLEETIVPVAGSTLAGWFKAADGNLGTLSPYLRVDAPLGFAIRFEGNETLMPTLKRLVALSLQMQGLPADSDAIRQTEKLLDSFVPLQFAGSVDMDKGIQFGGIYQFPGKDAAAVYADMKEFLQKSIQSQVGGDRPYSSIDLAENQRKVGGVTVDRATMVVNLDAPIYQMPGQKEMIESLWPGGKMIFDYALKGKDLFMGTPEKLDGLLAGSVAAPAYTPEGVNSKTMAYGYINIFKFVSSIMSANPMMSDEDKEKLKQIDSTGTAINFRVDLGDRFLYRADLPLKLFKNIGQLSED